MKQAIAGVTPPEVEEVTVMIVWPSIAKFALGRFMGRCFNIKAGMYIFRVGNLCALLGIPFALALYFYRLTPSFFGTPWHGGFYRLTNRRVAALRNEVRMGDRFPFLKFKYGVTVKSVELDRFNTIDIERLPGHEWFDAGDLVFRLDGVETFRLEGVSRPESFRHTCLKSHQSYVGVKRALARQAVPA